MTDPTPARPAPTKPEPKWLTPVILAIAIPATIGLAIGLSKLTDWWNAPPPPGPPETRDHIRMRAAAGQALLLRTTMRDPASFEVVRVIVMPGVAVCYEYRATNGFGGKNVELAAWDGDTFRIQTMPGFARAYNRICGAAGGVDVTSGVDAILKYTPP